MFLSMWSSVSGRVMDQKKKTLGILLGPMCYGVACGSHCVVWQVVASCGVEEGRRSTGSSQGGCQRS